MIALYTYRYNKYNTRAAWWNGIDMAKLKPNVTFYMSLRYTSPDGWSKHVDLKAEMDEDEIATFIKDMESIGFVRWG